MKNKILIYCDYGCNNIEQLKKTLTIHFKSSGIKIELTDAAKILNGSLNKTVLAIVLPGGAANPYYKKLKGQGNDYIRNYILNGGNYLGICAGAYYACNYVKFETKIPELSITAHYGLDLIKGQAIGTLYKDFGIKPYSLDTSSEAIVQLNSPNSDQEYYSQYHGGPYFKGLDDDCNILAYYTNTTPKKPAIISKRYGKGQVILSGVHFENTATSLLNRIYKGKFDEKIGLQNATKLAAKEFFRQQLSNLILEKIH